MSFGLFNTTQRGLQRPQQQQNKSLAFFLYFLSILFFLQYLTSLFQDLKILKEKGETKSLGKRTKAGSLLFRLLGCWGSAGLSRLVCYICDASRSAVCRIDHHRLRMKPARVIAFLCYSLYIYYSVYTSALQCFM